MCLSLFLLLIFGVKHVKVRMLKHDILILKSLLFGNILKFSEF